MFILKVCGWFFGVISVICFVNYIVSKIKFIENELKNYSDDIGSNKNRLEVLENSQEEYIGEYLTWCVKIYGPNKWEIKPFKESDIDDEVNGHIKIDDEWCNKYEFFEYPKNPSVVEKRKELKKIKEKRKDKE